MSLMSNVRDPYEIASQEDRSAPRQKLRIDAGLRASGEHPFRVAVTDLSLSGFGCEAVSSLRPGAICWLTLPGMSGLQAEVVWNDGTQVGCAFSNLLARPVLDHILRRHTVSA